MNKRLIALAATIVVGLVFFLPSNALACNAAMLPAPDAVMLQSACSVQIAVPVVRQTVTYQSMAVPMMSYRMMAAPVYQRPAIVRRGLLGRMYLR